MARTTSCSCFGRPDDADAHDARRAPCRAGRGAQGALRGPPAVDRCSRRALLTIRGDWPVRGRVTRSTSKRSVTRCAASSRAPWSASLTGALREALDSVTQPAQLDTLAAAATIRPSPPATNWSACSTRMADARRRDRRRLRARRRRVDAELHGFSPDVLGLDLREIARSSRPPQRRASSDARAARRQPSLRSRCGSAGPRAEPDNAGAILADLIAVQGCGRTDPDVDRRDARPAGNRPGQCLRSRAHSRPPGRGSTNSREATASLRDGGEWTRASDDLATRGHLTGQRRAALLTPPPGTACGTNWPSRTTTSRHGATARHCPPRPVASKRPGGATSTTNGSCRCSDGAPSCASSSRCAPPASTRRGSNSSKARSPPTPPKTRSPAVSHEPRSPSESAPRGSTASTRSRTTSA